jgi:hypothetical protein
MLTALILALAATGQTRDYNLLAYQAPAAPPRAKTVHVDTASRPPKRLDGERQPTMSYDAGPVIRAVVEPAAAEAPLALDPTDQVLPAVQAPPVASFQSAPTVQAAPATACYSSSYAAAPATACYSSSYGAAPTYGAGYVAQPPVVTYIGAAPLDAGAEAVYAGQAMPAYSTGVTNYRAVARRGLFGGFRQKIRMTSSGAGMTCTAAGCY